MTFIRKIIRYSVLIGFCYIFVCICKSLSLLEIINKDWITWLKIENMLFIYLGILVVFYIFFIYTKSELTEIHILIKKHLLMIKLITFCLMTISFYKSYNTKLMIVFIFEFLFMYCILDYESYKQYTYDFNQINGISNFTEQTVIGKAKLTSNQRKVYVQLENLINKRKSTDSFNIGLIGEWGSGKTSITDTLIYELEKENKYFFLKLSALTFNETGNIIEYVKNFFGDLFKRYEIDYYFGNSNVAFLGSLAMLNNSTKSIKDIVESIKIDSFVDFEKERILFNDQVRRLLEISKRKNIILIIDDMDRTYQQDNIIKLLCEFSSINGLITIVSLNNDLNKKEDGYEYSSLDKYIHERIYLNDKKIFNHQLLTQQILESYNCISKKDNCFLSVNVHDRYSLFDLTDCFYSVDAIDPPVGKYSDYNIMLDIFFENLNLSNLGFEEYIKISVLETILNAKEFEKEKEFCNYDLKSLNLKFMSFFEVLLLIYENTSSPIEFIKQNINSFNELYSYIINRRVPAVSDENYFCNLKEFKSIIFFDQQSLIEDLIRNRKYIELNRMIYAKIKNMYFFVLIMAKLVSFIDYLDDVLINYRTLKNMLKDTEVRDTNFLEYLIDEWEKNYEIKDRLKVLENRYYTVVKSLRVQDNSIANFLNSIFVHKYIFQFRNRFEIEEYGDSRIYIYHGDKRKIIILENKNSNGIKKVFMDITGTIIEYGGLSSEEKKGIIEKSKIIWSVKNSRLNIESINGVV